jgi:hypothetical protein
MSNIEFRKYSVCFREKFAFLPNLTLTPTTVESRDVLGIEDYRKESCIPIQHIKSISKVLRWFGKQLIYSR